MSSQRILSFSNRSWLPGVLLFAWLAVPAPSAAQPAAAAGEGSAGASRPSNDAESPEPSAASPVTDNASKPWAKGVSAEAQSAALAEFKSGNAFFVERQYGEASTHYLRALEHWQHPAIYFNLAVCQVNLDQPIAAQDNIARAVLFGAAPLGQDLFAQALTYKKLLFDRLGHLAVSTKDSGATVTLDGEALLRGPGTQARVLLPGTHQLVAKKPGFLPYTKAVQLVAGVPLSLDVKMVALSEATEFERPIAAWIPWGVAGGGAVLGLLGAGMKLIASSKFDEYNQRFTAECPSGCYTAEGSPPDGIPPLSDRTASVEAQAKAWDATAIATMSVGAAAVLTGVGLLIWNAPRPVLSGDSAKRTWRPRFEPMLGPQVAGLHAATSF